MSRIDPETLAALMEGRLSDDERARVLAVLAESDADLEILADAAVAAAALDEGAGGSDGSAGTPPGPRDGPPPAPSPAGVAISPAPVRSGIRWKVWLPLAAAAAAVALIPTLLDGPEGAGLGQLRLDLVALGPVASPADLPVAAGGDPMRSGGATADLIDGLSPVARSFRRGGAFARLTVLAPGARDGSPEAAALDALLRSTAGGAARPAVQAWLGNATDGESTWRSAAEALQQVEGEGAAFRLGLLVESISLAGATSGLDAASASRWAESLEFEFGNLPPGARTALESDYRELRDALRAPAPDPALLAGALEAFAAAAAGLGPPSDAGA